MNKFLLSIALLFVGLVSVNAQDYKPFKLGIGLGYAMPKGGGGVLWDLEPAYRLNDQLCVGLRIEGAAMARSIGDEEGSVSGNGSYTLNGQYYLSDAKFRPYVGLGFGIYNLASVAVGTNAAGVDSESKIGFYPRVGFDLGHFNMNLDYNLIGATEVEDLSGGGNDLEVKNSYLGIRFGAFIFGGKR